MLFRSGLVFSERARPDRQNDVRSKRRRGGSAQGQRTLLDGKIKVLAEAHEDRGGPVFVHFMPGRSLKVKCWEGSGRMSSACGRRFRIKDLGGGVSMAVTARGKGVNKVGEEGTRRDGSGVLRTGI